MKKRSTKEMQNHVINALISTSILHMYFRVILYKFLTYRPKTQFSYFTRISIRRFIYDGFYGYGKYQYIYTIVIFVISFCVFLKLSKYRFRKLDVILLTIVAVILITALGSGISFLKAIF